MDNNDKQRISLYLDRDLVKKGDNLQRKLGYNSRNILYSLALESFIAEKTINKNSDIFTQKLAYAIEKAVDHHTVKISKGLFRYAVELEIIIQILALTWEMPPERISEMRREAINNVRRTRGKVRLDDLFYRKDTDSL